MRGQGDLLELLSHVEERPETSSLSLSVLTGREHDLPPRWDGRPVQWDDWSEPVWTTLDWHLGDEWRACTGCGAIDQRETCMGRVQALPGDTRMVAVVRYTRSGHRYERTEERSSLVFAELTAMRCRHCNADVVLDHGRAEVWELDASDYGAAGSFKDRE